jgi:hypothetical protein
MRARKHPAKFMTGVDRDTILKIRVCGFVNIDANGIPFLSSGAVIHDWQFKRLLELDLLEPQGDCLFDGPSQTYILKEELNVC